ncbi:MAG: N-methyl-L-tryptophan oxidase [Anaerolineae bacterium]|nr:N-methyl-L-tryptophan oxidase [Anaerolineae bacterium]
MMNHTTDIIVIGAGVMGCAAAYHLAKRGLRVTLLEQFRIGHANGSSHGPSRVIRLNYEGVDYVQLARAAYAQWHELEADCGQKLLHYTGGMDIGEPEALAEMSATLTAANVAFETIDSAEIMRRSPQMRVPDNMIALYQNDYGILLADPCLAEMSRLARRHGANIVEGEAVQAIVPHDSGDGVTVQTQRASYQASRVIIAAGAWMRPLLRPLGVNLPLTVVKETIAYYKPADPTPFLPDRFPLFLQRFPNSTVIGCAFPIINHEGVKMIYDRHGEIVDPADEDRAIGREQFAKIRDYARQVLPNLGDNMIEAVTCRYTMTPDEDFIIDRLPNHPNIVIGSPCSGHGFKFGITIGNILADLAIEGRTAHDIQRFRLDRPALTGGLAWRLAG